MNPLLTELVWSRWLNYVQILFGVFIDLGPLKTQKKRLGQYTATVTSRLINNAYIGLCRGIRKPWALESGIQLKESRIRLTIGIQNPSSTDKTNRKDRSPHYQLCGMASRIRNQSTAWTRHNSRLSWISLHGAS